MKRVVIIGQLDGYGNSRKPTEILRFLSARGHDARLVDSSDLSRSRSRRRLARRLPAARPSAVALYATELASALLRRWGRGRRVLTYYLLRMEHGLRRRILRRSLPLDGADLVICETPIDAGVLKDVSARTLYDCPTPWADGVFLEGRLTPRQHDKLRRLERRDFENADHLAFHWDSYAQYAIDRYGITGGNLMTLNFGCTPVVRRARFTGPPRIVYLGYLGLRFIDLDLLSRLSRLYPHIDVYGGPPPDPALGLNHLGYAPSSVLENYQLGLITCSRDALMREGFSAKHLDYLAHGLPVLVPAWRRNQERLSGSVAYTEQSFRSVVDSLSDRARWQSLSDQAYAQAQRLAWDVTLDPLRTLLEELP